MKKLMTIIFFAVLTSCSNSSSVNEKGYKNFDNNDVWVCTIEEYNESEMKEFGKKWSNPMSNIVIMYYYPIGSTLPNLNGANTFDEAKERCISLNPIAAHWKYPNGQAALIDMR